MSRTFLSRASLTSVIPLCEGGGDTLIFSYIRRLGPFLGVQNFEFQYFLYIYIYIYFFFFFLGGGGGGGGQNNEYFCSVKFVDIFGVSSQNWTIFRDISILGGP